MKYLAVAVISVALSGITACQPQDEFLEPIELTISEAVANAEEYFDKRIRVTGSFNYCYSRGCRICEVKDHSVFETDNEKDWDKEDATCMQVSFNEEDYSYDKFVRFSTVKLEGKFRLNEIVMAEKAVEATRKAREVGEIESDDEITVVCADRCPDLENAIVTEIVVRFPPTDITLIDIGSAYLKVVEPETDQALRSAFSSQKLSEFENLGEPFKTYLYEKGGQDGPLRGGVCFCSSYENDCKHDIRQEGHVFSKTMQREYHCYDAEFVNGDWKFGPFF